jgi:hypothetical protein
MVYEQFSKTKDFNPVPVYKTETAAKREKIVQQERSLFIINIETLQHQMFIGSGLEVLSMSKSEFCGSNSSCHNGSLSPG